MSASKARMLREIAELTAQRDDLRRLLALVVRRADPGSDVPEWPLAEPPPPGFYRWLDVAVEASVVSARDGHERSHHY